MLTSRQLPALLALLGLLAACATSGPGAAPAPTGAVPHSSPRPTQPPASPTPDSIASAMPPTPPSTSATPPSPTAARLAAMTTEQLIGQLFMVEVFGASAHDPGAEARQANRAAHGVDTPAEVVSAHQVGGVIYFEHPGVAGDVTNVQGPEQLATLSADLHAAAAAATGVGLLIAVDQEGGRVARIHEPATVFPAAARIGATGDVGLARDVAGVIGSELRALGIGIDFAPVADVATHPSSAIGDRAFSADPDVVAAMAAAQVEGFRAAGVAPTVKHFPGHGSTPADSHETLPVIARDEAALRAVDLPPFAAGIAAGAPLVMIGHLAVPALDPTGTPSSVSRPIVTDLLRGEMGFDGVVVTDGLNMDALDDVGDSGEIAVRALEAGVDVLLLPRDLPAAIAGVRAAVDSGRLDTERIIASVRRILELKAALGVLDAPGIDPSAAAATVGAPAHAGVRERVREACGC